MPKVGPVGRWYASSLSHRFGRAPTGAVPVDLSPQRSGRAGGARLARRTGKSSPRAGAPVRPTPLPTSEERLRRVTLGGPRRHDARITLSRYDRSWPRRFSQEERRIRKALGSTVRLLEHVGSTAVPGLAAKPIIDILLVVPDSADEGTYVPSLEAAGYTLRIREPDWHQHRLLKGPHEGVNLHVFSVGAKEVERMVRFRDRLRSDPEARERYARTKRALAQRTWEFVQDYADAKSKVVESILRERERPARRRSKRSSPPASAATGRRSRGNSPAG
jgi:GrpB-like predicted nucleotidyltransferase (UPF0157 family)